MNNEREELRKQLTQLKQLTQSLPSPDIFQRIGEFSETYHALQLFKELKAGKDIDELVDALDDKQVADAFHSVTAVFHLFGGMLLVVFQVLASVERSLVPPQPPLETDE